MKKLYVFIVISCIFRLYSSDEPYFAPLARAPRFISARTFEVTSAMLPRSIRNAYEGQLLAIRDKIERGEELTPDEQKELQYRIHLDLMERAGVRPSISAVQEREE